MLIYSTTNSSLLVKAPTVYITLFLAVLLSFSDKIKAQDSTSSNLIALETEINTRSAAIEKKMIAWREDIHQHPELGDREIRTSKLVADHLKSLGIDVTQGVARTGVDRCRH